MPESKFGKLTERELETRKRMEAIAKEETEC
jgi:hypothetical protein